MARYAENISTDFGTPAALNPNDWDYSGGWRVSPGGVHIKWDGCDGTTPLYIAEGGTATIGDWADLGTVSYVGASCVIGALVVCSGTSGFGDGSVVGEGCTFAGAMWIYDDCAIGKNVSFGAGALVNAGVTVADGWSFGAGCSLGRGSRFDPGDEKDPVSLLINGGAVMVFDTAVTLAFNPRETSAHTAIVWNEGYEEEAETQDLTRSLTRPWTLKPDGTGMRTVYARFIADDDSPHD